VRRCLPAPPPGAASRSGMPTASTSRPSASCSSSLRVPSAAATRACSAARPVRQPRAASAARSALGTCRTRRPQQALRGAGTRPWRCAALRRAGGALAPRGAGTVCRSSVLRAPCSRHSESWRPRYAGWPSSTASADSSSTLQPSSAPPAPAGPRCVSVACRTRPPRREGSTLCAPTFCAAPGRAGRGLLRVAQGRAHGRRVRPVPCALRHALLPRRQLQRRRRGRVRALLSHRPPRQALRCAPRARARGQPGEAAAAGQRGGQPAAPVVRAG